jgi:antitoxin PrlF
MAGAHSKITAQGQISVPAVIREKLGVGPGSVLEWIDKDGTIVVQKARRYTSEEIHKALFPNGPPKRRSLQKLKKGLERAIGEHYARL